MDFGSLTINPGEKPPYVDYNEVILNQDATIYRGTRDQCRAFKDGFMFCLETGIKYSEKDQPNESDYS